MEFEFEKDDFLARWHSNALSEDERTAFEASEDFWYYDAILKGTDVLEVPAYDKEAAFAKIKLETFKEEDRKVRTLPFWIYGIAASMVAFFGLWFVFNAQDTAYTTGFGEQLAVSLPDGSKARLNSSSNLSYNPKDWENERTLSLVGQAFFEVKKGSTFTVATDKGTVKVLGTQFSVATEGGVFEVVCFEGKVGVSSEGQQEQLTKGQAVRLVDGSWERWQTTRETPGWLQERSVFKDAPLSQVMDALSKQYGKAIDTSKIDINQRFTGSFTHKNLELALRTICESMEITYALTDENTIVFVKR